MPNSNKIAAGFASIAFSVFMLAFAIAPVMNAPAFVIGGVA